MYIGLISFIGFINTHTHTQQCHDVERNTILNISGLPRVSKYDRCCLVLMGTYSLHTWTYYGLVGMWKHWSQNTWMLCTHMGTCIWEHGNLLICKYESMKIVGTLQTSMLASTISTMSTFCFASTTYRTCNINLKFNMQHSQFDRSKRDDRHLTGTKHKQCLHVRSSTPKPSINVVTGTPWQQYWYN